MNIVRCTSRFGFGPALLALIIAVAVAWPVTADAAKRKLQRAGGYSSIVIDATTGRVLHEDNADRQRYPASLTKMMTLYMIFEALDAGRVKLSTTWPVSAHAADQSPTKLGLDKGDRIAVRDVILGLITKSANDAAVVAAEALGGTEDKFGEQMTQRARRLGMRATTFQNASGLPDPGQVTTARDMATLSRALIRDFPHYYSYFSTPEFTYGGRRHANHNRLMNWYEGADGIKTGFIRASGFNLSASAVRDNRRVIGVVLGGPSPVARDKYMGKLLDTAFARMDGLPEIRHAAAPAVTVASNPAPSIVEPPSRAARAVSTADRRGRSEPVVQLTEAAPATDTNSKRTKVARGERPRGVPLVAANAAHEVGDDNDWSVQVGAFNRIDAARRAAENAVKLAAAPLGDAGVEISTTGKKKKSIHRARLVGLSETDAREACRILERRKHDCLLVAPAPGSRGTSRSVAAN